MHRLMQAEMHRTNSEAMCSRYFRILENQNFWQLAKTGEKRVKS
jgi:hypothetical protein